MRASLLLVVAIAVIAGLGVVVAVKSLGLLDKPRVVEKEPEKPAPPVPAPPPPPRVLVGQRPLFMDDCITSFLDTLTIREVRPDELKEYNAHKEEYLQPLYDAAYLRYLAKNIEADIPLKKSDFKEIKKPESLNARLFPGTRAVNIGVMKDRSAGGNIQLGDWVDVYLMTEVSRTDNPNPVPYTALLVPHAEVIAKRNSLFPIYSGLPEGKPVEFTIATNPYRAALLEHASMIGVLSIVPVPADEKKRLDNLRTEALKSPGDVSIAATFAPPGSPEFKEEQARLERYSNGSLSIGDDDLVKLLRLPPIEPPAAPPKQPKPPKPPKPTKPEPPPPPITVELYTGEIKTGTATFPVPYTPPPPPELPDPPEPPEPVYVPPPPAKYRFHSPKAQGSDGKPIAPKPVTPQGK
jgi:Flp pilus assembly protein CpaB